MKLNTFRPGRWGRAADTLGNCALLKFEGVPAKGPVGEECHTPKPNSVKSSALGTNIRGAGVGLVDSHPSSIIRIVK